MLFDAPTLLAYTAACIALIIAPGPGQALVIARTLSGGARAGVLTATGLQVGTVGHTFAAALGLSALLAASATAFSVVKFVGAAYLLVLGVLALMRSRRAVGASGSSTAPRVDDRRLLIHGIVTGTFNPKVALFFLAFLPQFVHPERGHLFLQFVCLGLMLATLGLLGDSTVALLTARASGKLLRDSRFAIWRERVTGSVLIALGLRLALANRR
jgi:threonine/homoserine/homoserine lactone efflux protein